jgi:hypothetical protein
VLIGILRHLGNFGEVNASLEPLKPVFLLAEPLCCWFLATASPIFTTFFPSLSAVVLFRLRTLHLHSLFEHSSKDGLTILLEGGGGVESKVYL